MSKKAKIGSLVKSSPFAASKRPSIATSIFPPADPSASSIYSAPMPAVGEASGSDNCQNVVVCVRMRPTRSDHSDKEDIWSCDRVKNQIIPTDLHPAIAKRTTSSERAGASLPTLLSTHDLEQDDPSSSTSIYNFQFDKLVCEGEDTDDMYNLHISPVVRAAVEGYNGTVFAYGQTGSGKTHTMSGSTSEPGVIPRAVQQVFAMIANEPEREFLLRVSYLEIYNETLKDLLAPLPPTAGASSLQTTDRPASPIKGGSSHAAGQSQSSVLRIIEDQKQNRVVITGLREEIVTDAHTVLDLIHRGQEERHVGATDWNERSSRSHCVFQLTVESRSKSTDAASGKEVRVSQLNLIDLAGSERAASQAERRKEGAFINKSLLTLGTVIGKLTEPCDSGDAHIPYRDSKLTRILQTSLAGNARIAVICTLSPDLEHANETLSTLKFGKRCKLVVTTAKKGVNMDDKALLQKYRKELDSLRARLEANNAQSPDQSVNMTSAGSSSVDTELAQQRLDELKQETELAQQQVSDMHRKRTDLKSQIDHLTRLILTSHSVARDNDPLAAAEALESAGAPGTPVRRRTAHTPALARRGPRMSDFPSLFTKPSSADAGAAESSTLSGARPFQLEAELAALRRQLRQQLELRQTLTNAHEVELAARDATQAELAEAIRLNKEELDKNRIAYDAVKTDCDDLRKNAQQQQQLALEQKAQLLQEQEALRQLQVDAKARADEQEQALQSQISALQNQLSAKEAEAETFKSESHARLAQITATLEAHLTDARQAHLLEKTNKDEIEAQLGRLTQAYEQVKTTKADAEARLDEVERAHELEKKAKVEAEAQLVNVREAHEQEKTSKVEIEAQLIETRRAHELEKTNKASAESQLDEIIQAHELEKKAKADVEAQLAGAREAHEQEKMTKADIEAQLGETRQLYELEKKRKAEVEVQLTDVREAHEQGKTIKANIEARLGESRQLYQVEKESKVEIEAQLDDIRQAHESERKSKAEIEAQLTNVREAYDQEKTSKVDIEAQLVEIRQAHEQERSGKTVIEAQLARLQQDKEEALAELEQTKASLASFVDNAALETAKTDALLIEHKEQAAQVPQLKAELDLAHKALCDKEQATASKLTEMDAEIQSLKTQLNQSKDDQALIQTELETLQASASKHEQVHVEVLALQNSLALAESKIVDLENDVLVERQKATQRSTVAAAQSVESPVSAMKGFAVSRLLDVGAVASAPVTPNDAVKGHSRGGSVKEYRRYQPADLQDSPSQSPSQAALATRSVLLGHRATFDTSRSNLALNATTTKAEKEEIERLNAVINSQRAIMADLEKSVASWKTQMHAQAQLIQQLVLNNNNGAVSAHSPPISDEEDSRLATRSSHESALSELSHNTYRLESPPVRRKAAFDTAKLASDDDHTGRVHASLPRTTHLSLATNPKMEPYYGAHSYNRPPISTGSPLKKLDYSSSTWSGTGGIVPSPLPLPSSESLTSSPSRTISSPSKRKPRKTIEMDLQLLNASPRVESNIKNKFCFDSPHATSQDTPTKRRVNNSSYYI